MRLLARPSTPVIWMALGAQRLQVVWLFLRGTLVPVGLGLTIGVAGATATGRCCAECSCRRTRSIPSPSQSWSCCWRWSRWLRAWRRPGVHQRWSHSGGTGGLDPSELAPASLVLIERGRRAFGWRVDMWRWTTRILIGLCAGLVVAAGSGATCQWMSTRKELAETPPPGGSWTSEGTDFISGAPARASPR